MNLGRYKKIFLYGFLICVGTFISHSAYAQTTKEEVRSLFAKANFAYKDGKYQEAIDIYEDIISSGWESGPIYYNLANSYVKKGNVAKAILNYERAKRLIPRDSDLIANDGYTESLRKERIQESIQLNFIQKIIRGIVRRLTFNEMTISLFTICFLAALIHLFALYYSSFRKEGRLILSILFFLIFLNAIGIIDKYYEGKDRYVILRDTDSKFEPKQEATTYFHIYAGSIVKILKDQGIWVKMERPDGKAGWILKKDIEKI